MDTRNKRPFGSDKPPSVNLDGASFSQVEASPSELRELAKSRLRLRELLLVDQRTPEERKLENEEMLRKLQRMRPDLYDQFGRCGGRQLGAGTARVSQRRQSQMRPPAERRSGRENTGAAPRQDRGAEARFPPGSGSAGVCLLAHRGKWSIVAHSVLNGLHHDYRRAA